jgi:hypothetical protein
VELKFGCEIVSDGGKHIFAICAEQNGEPGPLGRDSDGEAIWEMPSNRILGRPIRLADVLLAIAETKAWGRVKPKSAQSEEQYQSVLKGRSDISGKLIQGFWDLRRDDLQKQSDETINFIYELLK